jgi:sulfite exporter TauE/SafE
MDLNYGIAFLMGLTGSLHCAGMCGPIILAIPFKNNNYVIKILSILLYQFGRIGMYSLLGYILFSFKELFNPRIQQIVSITIGSLLLAASIIYLVPKLAAFWKFKLPWNQWVLTQLGRVFSKPSLAMLTLAGALNGLLPCGLVYMALSMSITAKSSVQMALLLLCFGVGTMPMMMSLALLKNKIQCVKQQGLQRLIPLFVVLYGTLFILRGANLGIPYLSPKVAIEQNAKKEIKIKHCCCHKN